MARQLERNGIGIEIKKSLKPIIEEKLGFGKNRKLIDNDKDSFEAVIRKAKKYGCVA